MTAARDPIDQLSRALDQTDAIISRAHPDQAEVPTPCGSWDLRALVNHVVLDVQSFTVMASGGTWEQREADVIRDDWTGAYRGAANSLLEAWRREGALDRKVDLALGQVAGDWRVSQQIADLVVHGWDIAKATGQAAGFDPELGQLALDWARENLRPEFRGDEASGKVFGPEVSVPDDAPVLDRLAGFFGRDPNWRGEGEER